jgi:hypothetical protein
MNSTFGGAACPIKIPRQRQVPRVRQEFQEEKADPADITILSQAPACATGNPVAGPVSLCPRILQNCRQKEQAGNIPPGFTSFPDWKPFRRRGARIIPIVGSGPA